MMNENTTAEDENPITQTNLPQQPISQEIRPIEHLPHPDLDNKIVRRRIDIWFYHISIPAIVFVALFIFDSKLQVDTRQLIKISGLMSIILLCITLIVGPLSKYIKFFNFVKVHRKFWGITAFFSATAHTILVIYRYYDWNIIETFSFSNPRVMPVWAGMSALIILFLITITSNRISMQKMGPKKWKLLQTTSYLALVLVVLHFILAETRNNVTNINRPFEYFSLAFAGVAIFIRLLVFVHVLVTKKKPVLQNTNQPTTTPPVQNP